MRRESEKKSLIRKERYREVTMCDKREAERETGLNLVYNYTRLSHLEMTHETLVDAQVMSLE